MKMKSKRFLTFFCVCLVVLALTGYATSRLYLKDEINPDTIFINGTIIQMDPSNSTAEAIELTAFAKKIGADASLQVAPYYNKPTQEGFYQHFKAVAEEADLPIVLYRVNKDGAVGFHSRRRCQLRVPRAWLPVADHPCWGAIQKTIYHHPEQHRQHL